MYFGSISFRMKRDVHIISYTPQGIYNVFRSSNMNLSLVQLDVIFKTVRLILDHSFLFGKLDKFKNCWNKNFRTSKIQTLLYQQFSNWFISQRDISGPRLGALSNKRWFKVLSRTHRFIYKKLSSNIYKHPYFLILIRVHIVLLLQMKKNINIVAVSHSCSVSERYYCSTASIRILIVWS
jgi:hypothetical protein